MSVQHRRSKEVAERGTDYTDGPATPVHEEVHIALWVVYAGHVHGVCIVFFVFFCVWRRHPPAGRPPRGGVYQSGRPPTPIRVTKGRC